MDSKEKDPSHYIKQSKPSGFLEESASSDDFNDDRDSSDDEVIRQESLFVAMQTKKFDDDEDEEEFKSPDLNSGDEGNPFDNETTFDRDENEAGDFYDDMFEIKDQPMLSVINDTEIQVPNKTYK